MKPGKPPREISIGNDYLIRFESLKGDQTDKTSCYEILQRNKLLNDAFLEITFGQNPNIEFGLIFDEDSPLSTPLLVIVDLVSLINSKRTDLIQLAQENWPLDYEEHEILILDEDSPFYFKRDIKDLS